MLTKYFVTPSKAVITKVLIDGYLCTVVECGCIKNNRKFRKGRKRKIEKIIKDKWIRII